MTALRVGFWGNFGTGNWGNECTLQAMVHNVKKRLPDAELSCLCLGPLDTEARHRLPSFPIRRRAVLPPAGLTATGSRATARRALEEAREWRSAVIRAHGFDVIVMTGTGMLTDVGEHRLGLPYDLFRWAAAAKANGTRVLFVSVGVEPIHDALARFFLVSALRLADYRSYRDAQSMELLARNGFSSQGDSVFPDLAFSLPASMCAIHDPASRRRPKVAVGLYAYRGAGSASGEDREAYRRYVDKMSIFVVRLRERGYGVRLVIGDLAYDRPVLHDVRTAVRARSALSVDDDPATSVEQVMRQLADADLVVASRFHNVLLALALGKPVLSISYNEKNDALLADMGLAAYCQSIDDFDVDGLMAQFQFLHANAATLRPTIAARASAYRAALDVQYDRLFAAGRKLERRSS